MENECPMTLAQDGTRWAPSEQGPIPTFGSGRSCAGRVVWLWPPEWDT